MMSISRRAYCWLTLCIISLFTLSACGGITSGNGSTSNPPQAIQVVAAENFYGDIVKQLGRQPRCGNKHPVQSQR